MVLFKNRAAWIAASIFIVLFLSVYYKPVKKVIQEKFENPESTESSDACALECDNKEIMTAVKRQFETKYVEGFANPEPVEEAFQDPSQLLALAKMSGVPDVSALGLPGLSNAGLGALASGTFAPGALASGNLSGLASLAPGLGSPPNLGAFAGGKALSVPGFSAEAPKPNQITRNILKVIKRSLKIDSNKCEYNIEYDESKLKNDGTTAERKGVLGYIQATFVKVGEEGCFYKPTEVKLLVGPQIIRYDTANPESIVPTIDYTF